MATRLDIDLETERVNFDGAWLSKDDLALRIQQMLGAGDFRISRVSEALEQLGQALTGARTLSFKLTSEQYAKLESAGGKVGKTAPAFARDLLVQVLGSAVAASATISSASNPIVSVTPISSAPVVIAAAATGQTSDVTPEEAAQAVTITPKRRGDTSPGVPPVMVPVGMPASAPQAATQPNVVVDLGAPDSDPSKRQGGAPGDGRRWFNRS